MFWFNACPRCRGDLYADSDFHGPYITCLQCSHYLTEAEQAKLRLARVKAAMKRLAVAEREKVAA